jgi:hypothetical protein
MKNIILKVPAFIFLLIILTPAVLSVMHVKLEFPSVLISYAIAIIWSVSLLHYMVGESKSNEYVIPIYLLLGLEFVAQAIAAYIKMTGGEKAMILDLGIVTLVAVILNGILMTKVVKKVFYARSTLYIFLEVTFIPIGMMTLTPEVQNWEKSEKI